METESACVCVVEVQKSNWLTIADIIRISLGIYTHNIYLEEEHVHTIEHQRWIFPHKRW